MIQWIKQDNPRLLPRDRWVSDCDNYHVVKYNNIGSGIKAYYKEMHFEEVNYLSVNQAMNACNNHKLQMEEITRIMTGKPKVGIKQIQCGDMDFCASENLGGRLYICGDYRVTHLSNSWKAYYQCNRINKDEELPSMEEAMIACYKHLHRPRWETVPRSELRCEPMGTGASDGIVISIYHGDIEVVRLGLSNPTYGPYLCHPEKYRIERDEFGPKGQSIWFTIQRLAD